MLTPVQKEALIYARRFETWSATMKPFERGKLSLECAAKALRQFVAETLDVEDIEPVPAEVSENYPFAPEAW
jgi:hypothetical protein